MAIGTIERVKMSAHPEPRAGRLVGGRLTGRPVRALAAMGLVGALVAPTSLQARGAPETFADLAEQLLPSVVNISTTQTVRQQAGPESFQFPKDSPFEEFFKDFFERQQRSPSRPQRRATSLGSGFVLDASGIIVTNNHVIAEADEINVILHDDTSLKAEIIGRDKKTDLAVLRVEPEQPLQAVKWGNSNKTRVGDWIIAIGNPFGLGGTVTAGIVSARARDIRSGPYDDFLQTDASINRGNSGGPMFNIDGEVIGINTAIYSPSGGSVGIGFAIPASLAKPVIDQLREHGRTRRGWLGVRIQQVTDEIAESLGLDSARGALVASVTEGGPAEKSGIEAGDVVLTFDGKEVPEMRRLPRIVAETKIGKQVDVEVWRKGKPEHIKVAIGELEEAEKAGLIDTGAGPADGPGGDTTETLGMTLSAISDALREEFELKDGAEGVVVTEVTDDGPAAEKGLQPGDVIVEVGQEEVSNPREVVSQVNKAREAKRKSVLLLIDRQGELRFIALRIEKG